MLPLPKRPLTKPPPWNSERFEEWTIAQLDRLDAEDDEANARLDEPAPDERLLQLQLGDPNYVAATEKDISDRLKRGRVIRAKRAGDHEALARLATTEELRLLALAPRSKGRAKGEPRPRDLSVLTRWRCEAALADMKRIHTLWKDAYPKLYRGSKPIALEFAARRWGFIGVPDEGIDHPPIDAGILRQRLLRLHLDEMWPPGIKLDEEIKFETLLSYKKRKKAI
jgi:hypothetical protein